MARKKKQQKRVQQRKPPAVSERAPSWHIPLILILTFLVYLPVFSSGFVNWDDPDYVVDNLLIRDWSRLPELLSTPVLGNLHPLTMFSLAVNYAISGDQAWSYHLFNLVFHLISCFLVYRLVFHLSKNNSLVAFVVSVLFAIHPMHVESVAWVSERKDVLYGMFFLAGHISYLRYVDGGSKKYYSYTFFLLLLSLLSKPAAVIFPVSLLCIDLLRNRKLSLRLISEKILFIIPAVIMGFLTVSTQKNIGATDAAYLGTFNNVLFGFYGIMIYFFKMVFPNNLSAFYPFPPINQDLPAVYYISPLFSVLLIALFYYGLKKHRFISFGISFYMINLLLVLQVFSVGSAVIAERYTYIPYIGLFYILGTLLSNYVKSERGKAYYYLTPVIIIFSVLAYMQVRKWDNGATLWDSVIKNHPSSRAYNSRASLFQKEGKLDTALMYFNEAIRLNMADKEAYNNRGNVYYGMNKFDSAYLDYRSSLQVDPAYHVTFDNLGALFASQNRFDSALFYLNKAIMQKPDYKEAYKNRGLVFMNIQRYQDAINDWQVFLRYQPDDPIVYNTIGLCYQKMGSDREALPYFDRAIAINPVAPFYLNRSYSHFNLKNIELAKRDAEAAMRAGAQIPDAYLQSLGLK